MEQRIKERWVFTEAELKNPQGVKRSDEFIADSLSGEIGIVVTRQGDATNLWADGTRGVPHDEQAYAAEQEQLIKGPAPVRCRYVEYAETWHDVWTNDAGDFLGFVDH